MSAITDRQDNFRAALDPYGAATHEVFNQPVELTEYNLFDSDAALKEAVDREGAGWARDGLGAFGARAGSADYLELGALANRYPPELDTHDRKRLFDIDEDAIKPYLQLDNMIDGAFFAAGRLFGLSFKERFDVPLYHRDVRSWTVLDRGDAPIALFIGDYFARPSKRSGAWMSSFRKQEKLDGAVLPVVVNALNLAKGADGAPSLLGFDEAKTLFHEFGHALHGMLSDVTYPLTSGTKVATDFVEFPSQLYEHWLEQPEILRRFAIHYQTGEPMPEAMVRKLLSAQEFNQGFSTVEYAAAAFVDLGLHARADQADIDVVAFEKAELERLGMPQAIAMRHRTPHFQHIFSGGGYASGYYSYLWSEALDADGFEAFVESGDIFSPDLSERLLKYIYSAGNLRDPETAYASFRGRSADPRALMRQRGFA